MNDILKQRLVGALILVALGVVFWPIIFVEPGERARMEQERIPPAPVIDSTPIEGPDQTGVQGSPEWEPDAAQYDQETAALASDDDGGADLAGVTAEGMPEPVAAAPASSQPVVRTEAPVPPAVDDKGLAVGWILQVASVSSASKADALRDRLLAMQEKAYVKKIESGEKDLYRVYIGPNFERAQLEKIQSSIDSRFGVHSMIVRYVP